MIKTVFLANALVTMLALFLMPWFGLNVLLVQAGIILALICIGTVSHEETAMGCLFLLACVVPSVVVQIVITILLMFL